MKELRFYFVLALIAALTACNQHSNERISTDVVTNPKSASGSEDNELPVIVFDRTDYDFGKLIQGEVATYDFTFTNKGKSDLLISQVNTSCGCTVSKFPKEPIAPGEKGTIKVTFDSSGRLGIQHKTVTVVSNCQPNSKVLKIKAVVIVP